MYLDFLNNLGSIPEIVGTNHTNKSLSTGDSINIEYDGEIEESNPPSITALRIEKLDNRDLLY